MRLFINGLSSESSPNQGFDSISNNSYSWWCKPISVYKYGYNWLSMVGDSGEQILYKIYSDGSNESVVINTTDLPKDEHNTSAFYIFPTHIVCCYANHNYNFSHYNIYDHDLNLLQAKAELFNSTPIITYNQIMYCSDTDRLFVFTRDTLSYWSMKYSDDKGYTWTAEKRIFAKDGSIDGAIYFIFSQISSTELLATSYNHAPAALDNNSLRPMIINMVTGDVTNKGSLKGNIYTDTEPIQLFSFSGMLPAITGWGYRMLDNSYDSNYTYVLFAYYDITEIDDGSVRSGNYVLQIMNNSDYTYQQYPIAPHGKDWFRTYWGGAYFEQSELSEWTGIIYTSREESETWYVEKWEFTGSGFTLLETVDWMASETTNGDDGLCLARPQPPLNSTLGGVGLVYQKGDYYENFLDWDNEIIIK